MDEALDDANRDEDMADPNERRPQAALDARVQNDGELSDSDDEGEGGRRDHASHKERDTVAAPGRRAAVGIMSTGTTHGVGPSGAGVTTAAASGSGAGAQAGTGGVTEQSDMEVDEGTPLSQTAKTKTTTVGESNGSRSETPGSGK